MRTLPAVALAFVLLLSAGVSVAQETVEPGAPAAVPQPEPAAASVARARAVSPQVASRLRNATPKFVPALAVKTPDDAPAAAEAEASRATIIRLPPFLVRERKQVMPKPREMLTVTGRLALARKKHPGLHFTVPILNLLNTDGIALAMLAEEERLEAMRDLAEMVNFTRLTDPAMAEKMERAGVDAFARPRDFGR